MNQVCQDMMSFVYRVSTRQMNMNSKNDLNEFVSNLRKYFKEEDGIVFPLALKAEAASGRIMHHHILR